MVYVKTFFVALCVALVSGCASLDIKNKVFENGYRVGVRENMADFARTFYGNDFPYFYWQSPIVQNVRIPSRVENGLFIPEHIEPVVITPAEWRGRFTYPIISREAKKEEIGAYEFENVDFSVSDITVLPRPSTRVKPGRENEDSR